MYLADEIAVFSHLEAASGDRVGFGGDADLPLQLLRLQRLEIHLLVEFLISTHLRPSSSIRGCNYSYRKLVAGFASAALMDW